MELMEDKMAQDEEVYVVDDMTDGEIKIVRDLSGFHKKAIIVGKITGDNLKIEKWGVVA